MKLELLGVVVNKIELFQTMFYVVQNKIELFPMTLDC